MRLRKPFMTHHAAPSHGRQGERIAKSSWGSGEDHDLAAGCRGQEGGHLSMDLGKGALQVDGRGGNNWPRPRGDSPSSAQSDGLARPPAARPEALAARTCLPRTAGCPRRRSPSRSCPEDVRLRTGPMLSSRRSPSPKLSAALTRELLLIDLEKARRRRLRRLVAKPVEVDHVRSQKSGLAASGLHW